MGTAALLAHAIEATDGQGNIVPQSQRKQKTHAASKELKRGEHRFFAARALGIVNELVESHPELKSVGSPLFGTRTVAVFAVVLAIILGYFANQLGPNQKINIVAFPLLGMVAWNLVIYVVELLRPVFGLFRNRSHPEGVRQEEHLGARLKYRLRSVRGKSELSPLESAIQLFDKNWGDASSQIRTAKRRSIFHLAAAVFAASMVGGMYLDGIAYEYRAIWQSTFLNATSVQSLVNTILGPGSAVSGIPIPDVTDMQWSEGEGNGQNAAPWIHLYAVTIATFIVVPRITLSLLWLICSLVCARRIPIREIAPVYFDQIVAEARGESMAIRVVTHSNYVVPEDMRKPVLDALAAQMGRPVDVDWTDSIPYGEEAEFVANLKELPKHLVFLFNFSTTPEEEIHGELLRMIREKSNSNASLQILLDASSFDRKRQSLPDFANRRKTREHNWRRILGEQGLGIFIVTNK